MLLPIHQCESEASKWNEILNVHYWQARKSFWSAKADLFEICMLTARERVDETIDA
jgi:hypothetical protein